MPKDELQTEYDFSKLGKATRGKYAAAFKQSSNLVLLDEDVAKAFPNDEAVNEALRLLINLAGQQVNYQVETVDTP